MSKTSRRQPSRKPRTRRSAPLPRKRVEEALRESEKKYRTLTENIAVGIFRSTPGPRGAFLEVNPALVKMLGYRTKKELLATEVAGIYQDPEDRLIFSEKLSRHGILKYQELNIRKKDGTPITVAETAIAVRDRKGKILYFDGIVEDITERKKASEEILIQKTYLEELFNSAPEAIILHDTTDRVLNVNDEFVTMFGYTREESVGRHVNDLVAPEAFRKEASMFSDSVIHGQRVEADSQRRRKDGTLIDVSILGAPIVHRGKQMGVYAIYRDITERKKAQEEILLQKTYLERLFNSAPEAIVLHDNNDRIVNVNDEFVRLFGYSREEAIGRPINTLVASDDYLEEAVKISEKVLRGERVELDSKRKRKDGTLIDVSILGAPIIHNGKQIGDYAIYRDISERKRESEELLIQKTYFEKLFNSAPEAIVLHDNDDRVVNINEEFTGMFGYSRDEAIGRPLNELVAPDILRDEASSLSDKVMHGKRVEMETRRRRKDGRLIDVSILGAPILYEGKQIGVYAIYRDISERKMAEEERIRSEAEARTARSIQANFLPKANPEIPGYDVAGISLPALNIGGDYYDFILLDDHRLAIGLGDVSGNGLPASLVMANVQATIRGLALFDPDPARCLERANTLLFRSTDSRTFVSLFYGVLDTRTHTLTYANAGQDPPVVFSSSGPPRILATRGIALGMKPEVSYAKDEIRINRGDCLVIYSDGIVEAMNDGKEELGAERLHEFIQANTGLASSALIGHIVNLVKAHVGAGQQVDDMTTVVLKRIGE